MTVLLDYLDLDFIIYNSAIINVTGPGTQVARDLATPLSKRHN